MVISYTIQRGKKTITVNLVKPISYWSYFPMKRKIEVDGETTVKIRRLSHQDVTKPVNYESAHIADITCKTALKKIS